MAVRRHARWPSRYVSTGPDTTGSRRLRYCERCQQASETAVLEMRRQCILLGLVEERRFLLQKIVNGQGSMSTKIERMYEKEVLEKMQCHEIRLGTTARDDMLTNRGVATEGLGFRSEKYRVELLE